MKTFDDIVAEANSLSWKQKQYLYIKYMARSITGKYFSYQFCYRGMTMERIKELNPTVNYPVTNIVSFDEFCSMNNIVSVDVGNRFKEDGYASQIIRSFKTDSIFRYLEINLRP